MLRHFKIFNSLGQVFETEIIHFCWLVKSQLIHLFGDFLKRWWIRIRIQEKFHIGRVFQDSILTPPPGENTDFWQENSSASSELCLIDDIIQPLFYAEGNMAAHRLKQILTKCYSVTDCSGML